MARPLVEEVTHGQRHGLRYNFHPGQRRAWRSRKRIVAIIAGTRAGKTSFGPLWLHREMVRQGPGDYLVATPTYRIADKAAAPEVEHFFGRRLGLGEMKLSPLQFVISPAGQERLWGRVHDRRARIVFGHADDPESLEALTAKGVWLDEPGQKRFKLGSWEAIRRRVSLDQGRLLLTSTPYSLGWLKQLIWDPWEKAKGSHPDIDVFSFPSTANPSFPAEEDAAARRSLPLWKYEQFYKGRFSRPAGLIYDCFDERLYKVPRFALPAQWPRYLGLDFGGVNTAGVFFAEELSGRAPTGKIYGYREYHAGRRTAAEHAKAILAGEPGIPTAVGGSHSEGQWRDEFAAGGLPVREPAVKDVEVGISRVYGAVKRGELYVFEDLEGLLDELRTYSRVLDDAGEPTEEIEDKSSYHLLDATRYAIGWLKGGTGPFEVSAGGGLIEREPGDGFAGDW